LGAILSDPVETLTLEGDKIGKGMAKPVGLEAKRGEMARKKQPYKTTKVFGTKNLSVRVILG
jgi:hypothetical protein